MNACLRGPDSRLQDSVDTLLQSVVGAADPRTLTPGDFDALHRAFGRVGLLSHPGLPGALRLRDVCAAAVLASRPATRQMRREFTSFLQHPQRAAGWARATGVPVSASKTTFPVDSNSTVRTPSTATPSHPSPAILDPALEAALLRAPGASEPTDRFLHLGVLASGGSGVVHAVEDRVLQRTIAVKRLHDTLRTETGIAFLREAQTLARVDHPTSSQSTTTASTAPTGRTS
jgi:hypothetical protein